MSEFSNDEPASGASEWVRSSFCANQGCVEARSSDDRIELRDSNQPDGPTLSFTRVEWQEFVRGIANGDFAF